MPKHLERQAYQSLLAHAQLCNSPDPEYDWDHIHDKNKRHAMNAVLDLEEARELNREMCEALKALEARVKCLGRSHFHYEAEYTALCVATVAARAAIAKAEAH
jgi:hypothetical protein